MQKKQFGVDLTPLVSHIIMTIFLLECKKNQARFMKS